MKILTKMHLKELTPFPISYFFYSSNLVIYISEVLCFIMHISSSDFQINIRFVYYNNTLH